MIEITDTEIIHKQYKFKAKLDGTKYCQQDRNLIALIYSKLTEPSKVLDGYIVRLSTYKSIKGYDSPQLDLFINIHYADKLIIDSVVFYPITFKQFFPYIEIVEKLEEIRLNINNNVSVISYKDLYIADIVKEMYHRYSFLSRISPKEKPTVCNSLLRNIDWNSL